MVTHSAALDTKTSVTVVGDGVGANVTDDSYAILRQTTPSWLEPVPQSFHAPPGVIASWDSRLEESPSLFACS